MCPRFIVTFTLHSADAAKCIRVVSGDGQGDHRSLADALDAASAGDLILLRPGSYSEPLHLTKVSFILFFPFISSKTG